MSEGYSDIPTDLGYGEAEQGGTCPGEGADGELTDAGDTMEAAYEYDSASLVDGGEHDREAAEPHAAAVTTPPTPSDPTAPTAAQLEAAADQQEHLTESDELQKLQQDMQQTSETTQLLSNIASMRHQAIMGIIGNIR